MKRAVYPGSFDPITYGHLDIIDRALQLFDELIIAVAVNPNKRALFSQEERCRMITEIVGNRSGLRVESFSGLLVTFVAARGAATIVKGLRAVSDFEFEFQMALLNRQLAPTLDTVFLMTQDRYAFLSSSSVREIASLGGSVHQLVPPSVEEALRVRFEVTPTPVSNGAHVVERD